MIATNLIAGALANKRASLTFGNNSVFAALNLYGNKEEDLNKVAGAIAASGMNDLILVKTKLLPFMETFTNLVKEKIAQSAAVNPYSQYRIIPRNIPEFVISLQVSGAIQPARTPSTLPVTVLSFPVPETPIKSLLTLVDPFMDKKLQMIVSQYTEEDLVGIWNKYLLNVSGGNNFINELSLYPVDNVDLVAVLYVLAIKLREERPAGVNIPEETFNLTMNYFVNELLNLLANAIKVMDTYTSVKRLVIRSENPFTLTVAGDVYKEFIAGGYESEVLLGMLTSVTSYDLENSTLADITAKADAYKSTWDKKVKLDKIAASYTEASKYKMFYSISLRELLENVPGDLTEFIKVSYADADKMLQAMLSGKESSFLMDVDFISKEVVGVILVPETNFYRFVNYMLEFSRINPSISGKDAASLASAEVIMDYLLQQVTVNDISRM
jgi:hypothetical protein